MVGASSDVTAPRVTSIERQDPVLVADERGQLDVARHVQRARDGNVDADGADFAVAGTSAATGGGPGDDFDGVRRDRVWGAIWRSLTATVTLSFASGQDIADTAGNALSDTVPTGANQPTYDGGQHPDRR